MRATHLALVLATPLLSLSIAGCSGSSGGGGGGAATFVVKSTVDGVAASTPLIADGALLAYLTSEASTAGNDMNGDGDTIDSIAVRVNTASGTRRQLQVATREIAFLNRTLFLVVDESADGKNWNGDGDTNDTVLLYVESAANSPTFFAELDGNQSGVMAVVGSRLLFASATAPAAQFETNLMSTAVSTAGGAPDAPVAVSSQVTDPASDGISFSIWKVQSDLAFLTADETVEGDLNGDGDSLDATVLALIDGALGAQVTSTGMAIDPTTSTDVLEVGGDWTVAFLVDEAGQGVNLNDPTLFAPNWQPPNCAGVPDADLSDQVLHWCLYSEFVSSGGHVVNTGLVGGGDPSEFVYAMSSGSSIFVGCVSHESDEGVGAGCDLNGDGDWNDRIFRWVDATDPLASPLPVTDETKLLAIADVVPGFNGDSTGGVIPLDPLWVVLVDEAADGRDHDGDPGTDQRLIGVHAPVNVGQGWTFDHGSTAPKPVSVSWMARNPRTRESFVAALTEASLGSDNNGDNDQSDSVATFPERLSGSTLVFPGVGIATDADDAGIVSGGGFGFFRLSEAADGNTDYNNDGDTNDFMLVRVDMSGAGNFLMGSLNALSGPAVVLPQSGTPQFGAFLYQENQVGPSGDDLNHDGDASDFVVCYFRFP